MTAAITDEAIGQRVGAWFPILSDRRRHRCHTDATDFYQVDYGDVLVLAGHPYLILNNAKEGRFGLDDEFLTTSRPASRPSNIFTARGRNTATSGGTISLSTVKAATTVGSILISIIATVKTYTAMIFSALVTS